MPRCYIFVVFLIVITLELYHNVKFVIYDDSHYAGLILHTIPIFFCEKLPIHILQPSLSFVVAIPFQFFAIMATTVPFSAF